MSTDDRARRDRVARLGELATEQQEQARAELNQADERVAQADRRRADALQGAADLAGEQLSLGLRAHLTVSGARHLVDLAGERADLAIEADRARSELFEAATRVRSLERLVERLDASAKERDRLRHAAELQDLVAIRAARHSESRGTSR